ncbi:MAG TPA: sugar-binding protein [Capsulimonadaceae bacterium]|jgi:hypothetical protein
MARYLTPTWCGITCALALASTAVQSIAASGNADWKRSAAALAADPSVVRYYAFNEGGGDTVRNIAANGTGTLDIGANDPYYDHSLVPYRPAQAFPYWTSGRFPGKNALAVDDAFASVVHSGFYGTDTKSMTVEMWVRPHTTAPSSGTAFLVSVGDGYSNGWKIATGSSGTSFTLGRVGGTGASVLATVPLAGFVWHHVVAEIDSESKALTLYVDGTLAARTATDCEYTHAAQAAWTRSTPELDTKGLAFGTTASFKNTLPYDIDELIIYRRALPADAIKAHYDAGKPSMTAKEQLAAYQASVTSLARLAAITVKAPTDNGYAPVGLQIPVSVVIPATETIAGRYSVVVKLSDIKGAALWRKESALAHAPKRLSSTTILVPKQACGLYNLVVDLVDPAGKRLKTATFPVGVRKAIPISSRGSSSSPVNTYGAIDDHVEDLSLGGKFERIAQQWCPPLPGGGYDWHYTDPYINAAVDKGVETLYMLSAPFTADAQYRTMRDMAQHPQEWAAWVRLVAERYKGKVHYWEVLNEPNSHELTPDEYVVLLKTAYETLKAVDPTCKVVGICGTANFADWTEDVLAAGGGKYLDIVTFHNYIGTSPIKSRKRYRKVARVKDAVMKYIGHPVPLWNGECGIHQPKRVNGRPITDDELLKSYPGRSGLTDGFATANVDAITMTAEHRSACWQVQSILVDLAAGAEKYFVLMGSNRYYPYTLTARQGLPSEKGIALAALVSATANMESVRDLPLSASDAGGVIVRGRRGENTAILFADRPINVPFEAGSTKVFQGMDYLGNPRTWTAQNGRLNLSLGEEPIYVFNVPQSFAETHLLTVTKFPANLAPRQSAVGEITLSNMTPGALSGTLTITADGCRVDPVKPVTVASGERKTLPFTVHGGDLTRGSHGIAAQFNQNGVVVSRAEHSFDSEGLAIPVMKSAHPIALDGSIAPWAAIPEERSNQASQVVIGRPDVGVADPRWWQGPSDLSYTVQSTWRDDGLYVRINVTDNKLTVAAQGKERLGYLWDCVELFIDGRELRNRVAAYTPGAEQMIVVPNISETLAPCAVVNFAHAAPTFDAQFVGKRTATGYFVDGRIKPLDSGRTVLAPGAHFGFDVAIDDADDAQRRVQMALHGTMNNSIDTSAWGSYELMP